MSVVSLDSIRGRLIAGFVVLIGLLVVAGLYGYTTIGTLSEELGGALGQVQRETSRSADLRTSVARELGESLRAVAPAARVDAQASWLAPVFGAIRSLQLLALALILLLAAATVAAVLLAARTALGANRDTIEIVHLLGGTDSQIARIFQRSIGIDAAVVDPWRPHLHGPGRGQDLARLVRAVAHHQPVPVLVPLADEPGDIGVNLGLQGLGQHPPGTLADDLIDQRPTTITAGVISVGNSRNYGKHGSYLPDRRWRADLA